MFRLLEPALLGVLCFFYYSRFCIRLHFRARTSERIFSALDIRPAGAAFLENAGWNYFVYLLKH